MYVGNITVQFSAVFFDLWMGDEVKAGVKLHYFRNKVLHKFP